MLSSNSVSPQGFDLPNRSRNELSQERKTSIEYALHRYRERVLELNMAALNTAVEDLERGDQPSLLWPRPRSSHASTEELRIEVLMEEHGIWLDPPDPTVTTVRDFLSEDRRETLIRTCRLDGASHDLIDHSHRSAWIEKTERKIVTAERALAHPDGLPADLKYLFSLVHGICGPGLPHDRFYGEIHTPRFLSDIEGCLDEDERRTDSGHVSVPYTDEELDDNEIPEKEKYSEIFNEWDNCEVALTVCTGNGGFAVYCREKGFLDGKSDGPWGWKYGLWLGSTMYESPLYDTIEGFLDFYAGYPGAASTSNSSPSSEASGTTSRII